jgi:hypothetical protein
MAATTIRPSLTSNSSNTSLATIDTILASARPRKVAALVESLDYRQFPFQRMLKSRSIDTVKPEWTDERYPPITVTADTAGYASGATTVNVVAGTGVRGQVWDILRNPATGELLQITAISTDAYTVVRGVGGSSAAAIAVSQALDILGPATTENVASPASPTTLGEFYFNYVQQFDYGFQVSELENRVDQSYLVRGKPYDAEVKRKMRVEAPRDLERTLLMGGRQVASGTGGSGVPYMMGGVLSFITVNTSALAGAAFSESTILDLRQQAWSDVGPEGVADKILLGIFAKRVISSWVDDRRWMDATDSKITMKLETWEDDLGTVQFVPMYHMPADTLAGVKTSNLTILNAAEWYDEPLAKDGPYRKGHVFGIYSLEALGDRSHFKVSGFSTTAANYPTLAAI